MKICILGESLSLNSGHSKPAYELSVELIKLGIDVIFLTNELDKEIKRKSLQLSEKHPELKKVDFITIKKFRWSEFEKDKIIKKIENCDNFHFFTPSLSVINKFTDLFPDRVIWQITSDYLTIDELYKNGRSYANYIFYNPKKTGNLISKYFYKFVGQKCKTVICTTKYMHARLHQLGFSTANLKYIPFGVNLNPDVEKSEIAIGKNFTYMYFGWLSPVRGITDLMYAFGKIHSKLKESKLIIANPGDHYEEEAILRRLNKSDYMDRVQVLTWQENINDTIKQADVVVLPFRGTFGYSQPPLVIVEAMINSKPVISSNIGCVNELIKNGETGLLIERGDIDGLVEAMITLQDKSKCSDMGQKAFEKIQQNSWQNVIDNYLDLYGKYGHKPINYSKVDIAKTLAGTANLFNQKAKDTILLENKGKHLLEIDLILKHIENKNRILDVGGGMGVNLICLSKLHKQNIELCLIDQFVEYTENNKMGSSDNGLKILKDAKVSIVKQNFIENPIFPYLSEYFDVITCFDVIEHLPTHPLKLFGEMKNKLKHNGVLIVGVPNATSLHRRMKLLIGKHPYIPFDEWCQERYYQHYREYSIYETKKLLEMAGFNVMETISSEEPIATMARSRYHNRQYALFSWITFVLYIHYILEKLLPGMCQSIYCIAQKRS